MKHFITYPSTKGINNIEFKLNSDDYSAIHIWQMSTYLKSKGYKYKYHRSYSKTKLMSWGCYKITTDEYVSWDDNKKIAHEIVSAAL